MQQVATTAAASTSGTASTSGRSPTATSAPRPAPAPTCTTCGPRTSRSTPRAATSTSTTGGSQNSEAPGNYADGNSWEPRDAVKGDVARMIFYMSVRYEGDDGFADLEVNDVAGNGSAPAHRPAVGAAPVERRGPARRVRDAPQRRHLRHLPAQPEPVRRPPGVGRRDLVARTVPPIGG